MADIDAELNLSLLQDQIRDKIAEWFPDFKTVEFDRDDEDERMPTPACLLEMPCAEPYPERDAGSDQLPAMLRFEARIVMAHNGPETHRAARLAATALATRLFQHTRFPPCDKVEVISCELDNFVPKPTHKFVVWLVEFAMVGFLGETAWKNDGSVPEDVLFSWSPDIGAGNEDKYQSATEAIP